MRPRVSVIVPFRDARGALPAVVNALRLQTLGLDDFEVIWIDDGSRDGGDLWLREHLGPRWRLLAFGRSRGAYAARNEGLRVAAAEHVAFTDVDCRPEACWLAEGLAALMQAPRAAGRIDVELSVGSLAELADAHRFLRQRRYVQEGFGATANLFVRRSVFGEVGGFIENLRSGGDQEFGWRCTKAGIPLVYADRAAVRHAARASLRDLLAKSERVGFGSGQLLRQRGIPVATVTSRALERFTIAARASDAGPSAHHERPMMYRLQAVHMLVFLATAAGGVRGFLSGSTAGQPGSILPHEVTDDATNVFAGDRNGESLAGRS